MTINAQLSITYLGSKEPSYIDEEVAMPSADGSSTLRAVTDHITSPPVLAVTSLSESIQHVTIQCLGTASGHKQVIDLAPNETLLLRPCHAPISHFADFQTLQSNAEGEKPDTEERASVSHGPLGIALSSDAKPGSFAAFALARHEANGEHFFSSIQFTDPKMLMSANTVFTGVPVGTASALPDGAFLPRLSVANFSNRDQRVRVKYATTASGTPDAKEIMSVVIPAGSTREIALEGLSGSPDLQNSFIVSSDGTPGDIVAKLVSTSEGRLHEVELLGKDKKEQQDGGGHPWSLEEGTDSILLLFNHTGKQQEFTVGISSGSILWQKVFTLKPMETKSVSFAALVRDRIKDDAGRVMPEDVTSGNVVWFTPDPEEGLGRLLEANRSTAMARNFSCGYYIVLCGASFNPFTTLWSFLDTAVPFGSVSGRSCTAWGPNMCYGDQYGSGGGSSYGWSSYDSGIASISGSSTGSSVNTYGAGAGQTYVNGTVYSQYCAQSSGGGATVLPTLRITNLSLSPTTLNSTGSVTLTVQMQLLGAVASGTHDVNVNISTAYTDPPGIGVHYDATTKIIHITSTTTSPVEQTFTITPGTSFSSGKVYISGSLTTSDTGISIKEPTNGQTMLTTTNP